MCSLYPPSESQNEVFEPLLPEVLPMMLVPCQSDHGTSSVATGVLTPDAEPPVKPAEGEYFMPQLVQGPVPDVLCTQNSRC